MPKGKINHAKTSRTGKAPLKIATYRNNQKGFEISYPTNWEKIVPHDDSVLMIRNLDIAAVVSIRIAPTKWSNEWYISKISPEMIKSMQKNGKDRFPDYKITDNSVSFLGSRKALLIVSEFSVSNFNTVINVINLQLSSVYHNNIYLLQLEVLRSNFDIALSEFKVISSTFSFR